MLLAGSEPVNLATVLGCAVALVARKTIVRINPVQTDHDLVAAHLGDDGRGADRSMSLIATDDGLAFDLPGSEGECRQAIAVNLNIMRFDAETENCPAHGQKRCLQNIQTIDLGPVRPGNRPGERSPSYFLR